jgi:HK97 family phage major capsid protein
LRNIKQLQQEKVDNDAVHARTRADLSALLAIPAADRNVEQRTRIATLEPQVTAAIERAATLTRELADAEREQQAELEEARALFAARDDGEQRPMAAKGFKWSQIFPAANASDLHGFESSVEYFAVLNSGRFDPRLRAATMKEGTGSGGGYSVPDGVLAPWWNTAIEGAIVMPRATIWPMTSDTRSVPAVDMMDRTSDVGGFSIAWKAEAATGDYQTIKLRRVKLNARKGMILAEASNELIADGVGLGEQLNNSLALGMRYGLDQNFLFGAGGAEPLGVLHANAGATIAVTKEAGQAAATIVYANILKMFSRLTPASYGAAVWVAHISTIPQLMTMSVTVGTGGSVVPALTQDANGNFRLLTIPLIFSEKMKPVGTRGDILLADFSQYFVGLRKDVTIEQSAHVGFTRDTNTYRVSLRMDGQPNIQAPYQPPNSADTISPFVTLEAR